MEWGIFKERTIPLKTLFNFSEYLENDNLYLFDDGSIGFGFWGSPPFLFAGEQGINTINAIYNCPKMTRGDTIQMGNYISSDISSYLKNYLQKKVVITTPNLYPSHIQKALKDYCEYNAKAFERATVYGLAGQKHYKPRNYVFFLTFRSRPSVQISLSTLLQEGGDIYEKLKEEIERVKLVRDNMKNIFTQGHIYLTELDVIGLRFLYRLIFYNQNLDAADSFFIDSDKKEFSDFLLNPGMDITTSEDLIVSGSNKIFSVYTAKDFVTGYFSDQNMKLLLNDPFDQNAQLPPNTLVTFTGTILDVEQGVNEISKLIMKEKMNKRFRKSDEKLRYLEQLEKVAYNGFPPLYGFLTVVGTSTIELVDPDLNHGYVCQTIESRLKRVGILPQKENLRKVPIFVSSLPFGYSSAMSSDVNRNIFMNTYNASCLSPVLDDFSGIPNPSINFVTRTGNIVGFDIFSKELGDNHVCIIVGSGGFGKSFLIQSLVTNYLAEDTHCCVIEVSMAESASYRNSTLALGGNYIDLTKLNLDELEYTLNPFAGLDELPVDLAQTIVSLLCYMAEVPMDKKGWADGIFDRIVRTAFDKHKGQTTIDHLVDLLKEDGETKALADALFPFTSSGRFGKYFTIEGKKIFNFDNPLTVIQIPPVEVVGEKLLNIMYLNAIFRYSSLVYSQDPKYKNKKKLAVYDEAHNVIFNPIIADLIAKQMRQFRRAYGGILIATQVYVDFFVDPTVKAMYDNASYKIIGRQDISTLNRLVEEKKLTLDQYTFKMFESIQKVQGMSEFLLVSGRFSTVVRHVGNKYELLLFGSSPQERAVLRQKVENGKSYAEAIEEALREQGALL